MRFFEVAAFHRLVSAETKEKINRLSGVKNKLGFLCFDWFELELKNGLKVRSCFELHIINFIRNRDTQTQFTFFQLTLEISVCFLLLLQAYLLYTNVLMA